jgi:hypothetical protein
MELTSLIEGRKEDASKAAPRQRSNGRQMAGQPPYARVVESDTRLRSQECRK